MKFIASEQGRVLDLVPIEELRPAGGIFLPDFIKSIFERYKFVSGPTDIKAAITSGAKFEHGTFTIHGSPVVVKELAVYSDGLIVEAFDTQAANLILDDFLRWSMETFKLRERRTEAHRTYTSVIIVEFERAAESSIGKLSQINKLLSESLHSAYGWAYEYNLQRLAFSVDPKIIPPLRQTQFYIERRLDTPYTENRYYSGAPVQTEEHLRLLETIERELLT